MNKKTKCMSKEQTQTYHKQNMGEGRLGLGGVEPTMPSSIFQPAERPVCVFWFGVETTNKNINTNLEKEF